MGGASSVFLGSSRASNSSPASASSSPKKVSQLFNRGGKKTLQKEVAPWEDWEFDTPRSHMSKDQAPSHRHRTTQELVDVIVKTPAFTMSDLFLPEPNEGGDDDDLSIVDEGKSILSASERYIDTRSVLKDEAADDAFGAVVQGRKTAVDVRFIFGEHKQMVQKQIEEEKAKSEAARQKLHSTALLAKMGAALGKKRPVVMLEQEQLDDVARALAACKSAKARAEITEALAAKLSENNEKVTVASVCGLFGLLKYEHENEKLVVLLAKHIADPENKDEFKKSVNEWNEVLRAFGDVNAHETLAAPAEGSSAASVIPNLLMRLKAEKVSSNREKFINKALNDNSDLKCTCADVLELLSALRYDHEKIIIFKRFIPLVTDPVNRQSVRRPILHLSPQHFVRVPSAHAPLTLFLLSMQVLTIAPLSLQPELELLFPMEARRVDVMRDDDASDVDSQRQRPGSASSFGSAGSDGTTGSGGTSAANSISRKEMERLAKLRSVKGEPVILLHSQPNIADCFHSRAAVLSDDTHGRQAGLQQQRTHVNPHGCIPC
jgi:hypothetical protein